MLAKRGPKPKVKPAPEEGEAEEELQEDDEFVQQEAIKMVDPMTTSLGREEEMKPFPGPPIADDETADGDGRPLFVHVAKYHAQQMPNEELAADYLQWLEGSAGRGVALCTPAYMLAQQTSEDFYESGAVLTDDDIARLDMEEEALLAEAEAAAAAARDDGADDAAVEAVLASFAVREMDDVQLVFKSGHLTICNAESHATAAGWAATDPVGLVGGYPETHLHEWLRLDEPALSMGAGGADCLQVYAIHCVDRADAGSLRADTREAHLAWMRESGRVVMAGPLVEPAAEEGAGARVGSLLIVNGDDLEEVRDWAKGDPYEAAGLFATVTVAPLNEYSIDDLVPV